MATVTMFLNPDPADEQLLQQLNRLRMTGVLCNAVLATSDGGSFRVHKIVMSLCSNYFRTLFTTSLKDKEPVGEDGCSQPNCYYLIPEVSSSTLRAIIDFAYSGTVEIDGENAIDILRAADYLIVTEMVGKCVDYLLENMTTENCIAIWQSGNFISNLKPKMVQEAKSFILKHFVEVSMYNEDFLNLKTKCLIGLLLSDSLNAPEELHVWNGIKRWIQHKLEKRRLLVPCLLQCVRLALLPLEEFQRVMDDPLVFNDPKCKPYIDMVSRYILNELQEASDLARDLDAFSMFTPRYPQELIFVIGGRDYLIHKLSIEAYDSRADMWKPMFDKEFKFLNTFHQVVNAGNFIYFLGGQKLSDVTSCCHRLDISDSSFKNIAPMHEKRCRLAAAILNDKIYAIGGFNENTFRNQLRTVEYFDPALNQWTYVSPMNEKRSDASAAALRNRIFVVGGFNGIERLQSAECYFEDLDQWFLLPPMLKCRMSLGCVCTDDAVYAIGGYDGETVLNSVEKYCIKDRQWLPVKPMKTARWNFAAAFLENKIYAMGGMTASPIHNRIDEAECFDATKLQWESIAPMNSARSVFGACAISDTRDVTPYIRDQQFRCRLRKDLQSDSGVDLVETSETFSC